MQCTSQLFPLRINQMRHWIHTAFQEFVYLVREVKWHRWRTASGVTCSAMFLHLQVPRGSEPIGGVEVVEEFPFIIRFANEDSASADFNLSTNLPLTQSWEWRRET